MTAKDRRALLLGAAIAGTAALLLRAAPWGAHRFGELRRTTSEREATLARARSILANRLAVRDSFEHVVAGIVGLAPHVLDGRTGVDAQASLSGLVSVAAGRHAVRLLRVDPVADTESALGAFGRVTVHIEIESDLAGLLKLIRALETADPVLTVTSFNISAPSQSTAMKSAEALRSEMNVAGYYLVRDTR